jgi:hypothetical protein
MFDTETMQKIKDIDVQSRPDGILLEPFTDKVLIFSHSSPSITMIDPKDGSIVGTVDIPDGAMEQAQSDGQGKLYCDVENQKKIAVVDLNNLTFTNNDRSFQQQETYNANGTVDVKTSFTTNSVTRVTVGKVTASYSLGDGAGEPGGLGFDVKNHILFAMCANPNVCVILNADDGKVLTTLPLDGGTDGGGFNPATMEAWSSQRNGTLTIIKESSPTSFAVEQTVTTKQGCKTSSLDTKNNRIVLICTERLPAAMDTNAAPAMAAAPATNAPAGQRRGGGGRGGPGNLDVLWVGR